MCVRVVVTELILDLQSSQRCDIFESERIDSRNDVVDRLEQGADICQYTDASETTGAERGNFYHTPE